MSKKNINIIILVIFILIISILSFWIVKYKNESENSYTSYNYDYESSKESEIEKLNNEITTYNSKITDLNNELSEYKNSIDSLKEEKAKAEKELEELNSKYNTLSLKKNSSNIDSGDLSKLKVEIEQKQKEIDDINSSIIEKETTISNLQNEISLKSTQITNLEEEIKTLKETFQVIYISGNNIVATYNVKKGNDVTSVPDVPDKIGYDGAWDSDGKNITSNKVISATYALKTYRINYNFDYNEVFPLLTGKVQIDNRDFTIYYRDNKRVIEYLDEYDIELLPNNEGRVVVDSKTYKLNFDINCIYEENVGYVGEFSNIDNNIFYDIEGKTFIYYPSTQKYKVVNSYKIRTDNVFVMDGKSYRIGGEDFKVYSLDNSYDLTDMYFWTFDSQIKITNNKLYDNNGTYKFDITNGKFNYGSEDLEYKYATDRVSIIYKKRDGSSAFKNDITLPTSYKYGDKYFELPDAVRHFNYLTSPSAHVGGWDVPFDVIDNKYILFEDTYGDITVYLSWSPVS